MFKFHPGTCCLIALLSCMAGPVFATTPGATGGDAAAPAEVSTEESPVTITEEPAYVPSDEELEAVKYYQELIDTLEREGGVYDSQLSEVMLGLGNLYQKFGRHGDAASLFDRAYHITRVNSGLYSLDQLALLEELI